MFISLLFDNFLLNGALCIVYVYNLLSAIFYFGEFFFIFIFLIATLSFKFFFYNSLLTLFLPKTATVDLLGNSSFVAGASISWTSLFNFSAPALFRS